MAFFCLEGRNAVAVYKPVYLDACFAEGAIIRRVAFIIGDIGFAVYASYRQVLAFINAGIDRAYTCRRAVIVANGFYSRTRCITRGNRCG